MHDENQTYTPLSAEPLDMAQRLRGYIEGLVVTADRDKEDPHWLIAQARKNYSHLPEHEAVETHRKALNLRPHMQRRIIQATLQHVLRLEYHLRCFILFLTAQIIELGRAGEPPEPREPPHPRDYALARKGDEELRDAQRDLPRINSFKVLTPVFGGKGRRPRKRGPRPYLMLPDRLKVVDAGHVFARIRRLEHVLANADKFAMSLAKRAVVATAPPSPLVGEGPRERGLGENLSPHPNPSPQVGGASELVSNTPPIIKHPLYFAPLANFCPPAEHYDSAPDTQQKRDFNLIHFLASSRLEQIGLGVRPAPYRGLPDLSCLDPPPPPQIRSL